MPNPFTQPRMVCLQDQEIQAKSYAHRNEILVYFLKQLQQQALITMQ